MALAGFLLIYFALLSNRWIEFYGPQGISPIKLRDHFTLIRPSIFSYLHSDQELWIYYGLTIFMLLALFCGRLGKWPAFFVWITMISVENSNSNNVNAEEFSLCVFAFYSLIMPINETLVLSLRRWRFSNSEEPVSAWSLYPFWLHIEIIYVISLPMKPFFDHAWVDGSLIYLAVNTFDMSRFPGLEIFRFDHAIFSKLMTWASLIVEALFPILVWTRRFGVLAIFSMIAFQVGIAVLLSGVQLFSLSMIIALILFFPSQTTHDLFYRPSMSRLREWLLPSKSETEPLN